MLTINAKKTNCIILSNCKFVGYLYNSTQFHVHAVSRINYVKYLSLINDCKNGKNILMLYTVKLNAQNFYPNS